MLIENKIWKYKYLFNKKKITLSFNDLINANFQEISEE